MAIHPDIAPGDAMYHGNDEHYFSVGRSALTCIEAALAVVEVEPAAVGRILDLGCGHGRVLRTLRARFPDAEIVATDVDADGVEFCATRFGAVPVVAPTDPAALAIVGPFDLVWCGSVLTHLAPVPFLALLRTVTSTLGRRGLAVVTTHGRRVAARIDAGVDDYGLGAAEAASLVAEARDGGFGYRDYPHADGYGISLTTASWLLTTLPTALPGTRVAAFMDAAWDHHQDVLVVGLDR
jgi:SAM-dependent methyltransferase